MTEGRASARGSGESRRRPGSLRRLRRRLRYLDKDLRLLATIVLIVVGALAACLMTIREVERYLIKSTATGAAVHWAEFLQSRLRGLDEILAAGLVSEDDQRIFEFAGAAGGVRDYQVIRRDGMVALSNWSGNFRNALNPETLRRVVEGGETVSTVIYEELAGTHLVIGEAHVPLAAGDGNRGALKVDVDMTGEAERFRRLGNAAFIALVALLLPPGGLAAWLIGRNILAQRRAEQLQRQRGLVLEALAKGIVLQRVLLRMARFAERHRLADRCMIVTLDPAGERVAAVIAPRRRETGAVFAGRRVEDLPEFFSRCLHGRGAHVSAVRGEEALWAVPLQATSGRPLGWFVLGFAGGLPAQLPDAEGPEMRLAYLAAFAIETRRAENALMELRQRSELILGAAADGIVGLDADGRVTFANPAAARLLGRGLEEMIGGDVEDFLRPLQEGGGEELPIAATLTDGRARQVEKTVIRGADGAPLPVRLAVTPVERRLSSLRAVVVFDDITSQIAAQRSLRRAAEEAEAANRSKSNFLAHMSHELRTPLNAIIGFSEVMAEETLGTLNHPQYHEYARHIHVSGQHLLSLINDLLDLSKIEAGKLELWEEEVDCGSLVQRCRVFIEDAAQNKGLALTLRVAEGLPSLRCDARKLKQVLVNLLSNAVKFTPAGGRVLLEAESDGAAGIVVRVSDTGIGIAPENIVKVMSPFGQVHEALNRDTQGTGLGLPLSRALVELHGGRLTLESELGKGTTARVELPGRAVASTLPGSPPAVTPQSLPETTQAPSGKARGEGRKRLGGAA
ncbi:PAS domain-containing sensor histidine kinase [Pelagibius sp. 7325]|uniref:sensor histidine kinase n=1 Tax=Pelagibius sp. 7325 TaxID=3131994 RepID=UPI0030EDB6E9